VKLKSKDFYHLSNSKLHCSSPTGTKRWSETCPTVEDSWSEFFTEHTIIDCQFTKSFVSQTVERFNFSNGTQFHPKIEETLFGPPKQYSAARVTRKFNYTCLFTKYYIYSSKLNDSSITLSEFIKITLKYKIETFT